LAEPVVTQAVAGNKPWYVVRSADLACRGRSRTYYLLPPFGNPDPAALLAGLTANIEIPA
jgi:hypothetical protein